mgnify:CR=1 FL=1
MTPIKYVRGSRRDNDGLVCRKCGCRHLPVRNTIRKGGRIVRYRVCRNCGATMTTTESTSHAN